MAGDIFFIPAAELAARIRRLPAEVFDAVQDVFERYDLLVTPTLATLPVDNAADGNALRPSEVNGEAVDPLIGWCLTYPINDTGHPAASIPAGLTDDVLLAASAAFERARPWSHIYPPR